FSACHHQPNRERAQMMKAWKRIACLALTLNLTALAFGHKIQTAKIDSSLAARIRRFAPTVLTDNTSSLAPKDRQALLKIVAAAKYYDRLYLRQIWSGNEALLHKLQGDKSPLGRLRLHYFMINKGPWSQLD